MFLNNTFASLAPMGDAGAPGQRVAIRLANTGTTESSNDQALMTQRLYTLRTGAAAVRVSFRAAAGISNAVATTDMIIPAYSAFPFVVEYDSSNANSLWGSRFVYIEAADGASAYEAWIVHSGR